MTFEELENTLGEVISNLEMKARVLGVDDVARGCSLLHVAWAMSSPEGRWRGWQVAAKVLTRSRVPDSRPQLIALLDCYEYLVSAVASTLDENHDPAWPEERDLTLEFQLEQASMWPMPMRAAAYVRPSRPEPYPYLESVLRDFAERVGFKIVETRTEHGLMPARITDKTLQELLELVRAGKVDAIVTDSSFVQMTERESLELKAAFGGRTVVVFAHQTSRKRKNDEDEDEDEV